MELMELQLKHKVEILLAEERLCLERHEKELAMRSNCLRSSAPRRVKRKPTKKRRIRTQNMIEEGMYWSDESAPESVKDGCLLLGLTQDLIDLD